MWQNSALPLPSSRAPPLLTLQATAVRRVSRPFRQTPSRPYLPLPSQPPLSRFLTPRSPRARPYSIPLFLGEAAARPTPTKSTPSPSMHQTMPTLLARPSRQRLFLFFLQPPPHHLHLNPVYQAVLLPLRSLPS